MRDVRLLFARAPIERAPVPAVDASRRSGAPDDEPIAPGLWTRPAIYAFASLRMIKTLAQTICRSGRLIVGCGAHCACASIGADGRLDREPRGQ